MLRVTAVVPTRNRPESLARCLDALDRQEGLPELEVVVVDDGSRDPGAVAATVARSRHARLLRSADSRGPASARNRGSRDADADVLLFTDDDCEPTVEWAARMVAAIECGAEVVAGTTANADPRDSLATASEAIRAYVQRRMTFAASNNLGVAARVFAAVEFDETYRFGEDRDWCARAIGAGYRLTIEPDAVVVHRQNLSLPSFLQQQFGYGRGAYRFRRRHDVHRGLEHAGFYAGLIGNGFEQGVVPGMLVGVAQAATAVGYLREALAGEQRRSA